jgi:hypothetical protein
MNKYVGEKGAGSDMGHLRTFQSYLQEDYTILINLWLRTVNSAWFTAKLINAKIM